MERRRVVRVPASSANLGPGFDSFAAALARHMQIEVVETGTFAVVTDLQIATDRRNLAVRGFAALHAPDDYEFRITSEIPLSGGLGTSAGAYVAGLMAADSIFELDADLLAEGTALEGHPDNIAAALEGGFVVCADGRSTRFDAPAGLEAVLVVPHEPVRTAAARAALPAEVPMAEAVFNVIARGLQDRLHQDRRAHLFPRSAELMGRAQELGALGATVSGAGPTVLFWCHYEQTGAVLEALRRAAAGWADVQRTAFESTGARVLSL
jgi:homoserine kinase